MFGGLKGRFEADGGWTTSATYNADVYVVAVVSETDRSRYNPLDVANWTFWVAGRRAIESAGTASLALGRVQQLSDGPLAYEDLAAAVRQHAAPGADDPAT